MFLEPIKKLSWSDIKALVASKNLPLQYIEQTELYTIMLIDSNMTLYTAIPKTTPTNADQDEFEASYKSTANTPLFNRVVSYDRSNGQEAGITSGRLHTLTQITGNDGLYKAFVDAEGRVSTNSNVTFPEVFYTDVDLLNGSSSTMRVQGTLGTPVVFRYTPPAGEIWYVDKLTMTMSDNANFTSTGFGGISALTNGLLLNIKTKGTIKEYRNIKNNYEVVRIFTNDVYSSVSTGLLNTDRLYRGSVIFNNRIALDGTLGDYVEAQVRDDLAGLTGLHINALLWRLNG